MTENSTELTQYLKSWRDGDASAAEEIFPRVYAEMRRIARRYRLRERGEHTFQTTEIINEAYLKLVHHSATDWQNRAHFFAVASVVMRNLLIDHARAKKYQKRSGERIDLEDAARFTPEPNERILALDEALKNLAAFDRRKSRIVELRYFGGLSAAETAHILGVSEITVKREWLKAKAWLYREISGGSDE